MGEAATEILPGLLVFLALGKAAVAELREHGMVLEILAVLAAVGIPSVGYILWGAGLNKLDDRYMDKKAFTTLRADVDREMAEVRTSHQTLIKKFEDIDEKVSSIMHDERHRDMKFERMEAQLTAVSAKLHTLEIDQLKGFSTLKDELRGHMDSSMKKQLQEIRDMVDRKI